jgi:hypothetical protein
MPYSCCRRVPLRGPFAGTEAWHFFEALSRRAYLHILSPQASVLQFSSFTLHVLPRRLTAFPERIRSNSRFYLCELHCSRSAKLSQLRGSLARAGSIQIASERDGLRTSPHLPTVVLPGLVNCRDHSLASQSPRVSWPLRI